MMGDQGDRTMDDQRAVRRRIAATVIAIGVVLFGVAVAPGAASATSIVVSGATSCRVDTWTVTWTARADADRNLNWSITSPTNVYSPSGYQDDSLAFTRTATYLATEASATENVTGRWSNNTTGRGSATVARPPLCEESTTTTTTTTTVPETTTTTTTLPVTTTSLGQQAPTTTTTQVATTTTQVGQQGATTTTQVGQQAATTTTVGPGGQLPATGGGGSLNLTVIALTLIGIGVVMLRLVSKPSR
jgi:hypothetical protein